MSNSISALTQGVTTPGSASTLGSASLGKEEFLKLLTAQLTNQDPMSPMNNEQFVAQLAQFSSLEQMQNVNDNLGTNILLSQSVNNSLATTLIGRNVEASGDSVHYTPGEKSNMDFKLSGDANVQVEVQDSTGHTVATLKPGDMKSGKNSVTWDGKSDDGTTTPEGDYTFKVTAKDAKGNVVGSESLIHGRVTGVRFENGVTYLVVGSRELRLSDIHQILESSGATP